MKETDDKIAVLGDSNYRFDIPKSMIISAGRNVILNIDFPERTIWIFHLIDLLFMFVMKHSCFRSVSYFFPMGIRTK
jgi:hypothetical protein